MLPKDLRLNLAEARWRYRYADHEISARFFKILIKKNKLANSRFGFLFTGKLGKAAERNLAKRRLSECVKKELGSFPSGFDFIFIGYPNSIEADYESLCAGLHHVLPKISLL